MPYRVLVLDRSDRHGISPALEAAGYEVEVRSPSPDSPAPPTLAEPDAVVVFADDAGDAAQALRNPTVPTVLVSREAGAAQGPTLGGKTLVETVVSSEDSEATRRAVLQALQALRSETENRRLQDSLESHSRRIRELEEQLSRERRKYQQLSRSGARAVAETELRYRDLFNLANDAIFTTCAETGRILDANLQAETLTRYSHEELTGMRISDLYREEGDRLAELEAEVARAGGSCGVTKDVTLVTREGSRLILSVSCSMLEQDGRRLIHHICRDVTELRRMESDLNRYTKQLEKICDEKTLQLLDSQAQLVQTEKMAALGSLVAGIAHEINTPLGSINSNNDIFNLTFEKLNRWIETHVPGHTPEAGDELEEILGIVGDSLRTNRLACERILRIVRSLRTFARLDEAERKKVDIHEGLDSTLTLVSHQLKGRVEVEKEYGDLPELDCYPNKLNQVFMNILVNASQAIEEQGRILIRTWEDGDNLKVSISDNGKGIPPELFGRIFEPGFTTKKAGMGTGLGLSICRQIMDDHGGRIELQSKVGEGTTFTLVLPKRGTQERKPNE